MKSIAALLLGSVVVPLVVSSSAAGPNASAKILMHLMPVTSKNACTRPGLPPSCQQINTQAALYPTLYFAYVLVEDANAAGGVGGLEFGIDYNGVAHSGVDIYSWNLCADSEVPSSGWPAAGSGNRVTWNSPSNCRRFEPGGAGTGVAAAAGYFYCAGYSPDLLQITRHPVSGQASITDCSGIVDSVYSPGRCEPTSKLGSAGFGRGGYNPCGANSTGGDCGNIGPAVVSAGATGVVYGDASLDRCLVESWSVSGNATIAGPANQRTVTLNIGAPGEFTLYHSCQVEVDAGFSCCKIVQVLAATPAVPSTWSGIKAGHH